MSSDLLHVSLPTRESGLSAGSRDVSELKPHRAILYEKARYVKTVNGRQSQKTVGAGEHRYRLRWIWGR